MQRNIVGLSAFLPLEDCALTIEDFKYADVISQGIIDCLINQITQ